MAQDAAYLARRDARIARAIATGTVNVNRRERAVTLDDVIMVLTGERHSAARRDSL